MKFGQLFFHIEESLGGVYSIDTGTHRTVNSPDALVFFDCANSR
jgi:hypothetical protein